MNGRYLLFLMLVCLFSALSCKTPVLNMNDPQLPMIQYGSGGGFAGIEKTYVLDGDGNLFEFDIETKLFEHISKAKKKELAQIQMLVSDLDLEHIQIQRPGNTYKYITFGPDKDFHRISWGDPSYVIPEEIDHLYQSLNNLITNE